MRTDTFLLLHAFPVGHAMWEPQLGAFPGWRVLAPSFPGFDGSERAPEASLDAYADFVCGYLDRNGVERAVVCGLSMGGYVAFRLIERFSSRVHALVLADTRAGADTGEGRAARVRMLDSLQQHGVAAVAEEMVPKLLGATTQGTRPRHVERVRTLICSQAADGIADAVRALAGRPDSAPVLSRIVVPTLVIVGEEDVVTPITEAERLRDGIAGARLVRIPGAGHLSNLEQPEAFNQAVRAFLES